MFRRLLSFLCILSLLLANSPREWLHFAHEIEECSVLALDHCEEEDLHGLCSHQAHFSNSPHECLLMHLSGASPGIAFEISQSAQASAPKIFFPCVHLRLVSQEWGTGVCRGPPVV
jgi:hypothetical protein